MTTQTIVHIQRALTRRGMAMLVALTLAVLASTSMVSAQSDSSLKANAAPDLVVTDVTFDASCNVTFDITNLGSVDVTANFPFIAWYIYVPAWGEEKQTGWSASILGLPAGQTVTQTWPNIYSFAPIIKVFVDPQEQISEGNEGNNIQHFSVPTACQVSHF